MTTRHRVRRQDRAWVDCTNVVLCGPFDMPSADALRRAVAAIASRYPHSRLTWSLDPTKKYWRNDRSVESIVVERDWDDSVDIGTHLDEVAHDTSLEPPLTVIRYPNHLSVKTLHCMGDGRVFMTIAAAILQTALNGEVGWPAQPAGRFPLAAAAARTFVRHPSRIMSAIGDRPARGSAHPPAGMSQWAPARHTHYATMSRAQADEMFAWGKETAPQASRFALQITLVLRALQRVGMEVSSDVHVLVDLRRYLGWRYIDGNFVSGVPMRMDWTMSPEQISSSIKATNASARPLAGQMQTSLRGGGPAMPESSVDRNGLPHLTFSNFGRPPEIDGLPFLPNGPTVYAGGVTPAGPLGLTVFTGEVSQVLGIAFSFHENVVDRAVVEDAMCLATSDPIGLLSASPAAL